MYQRNWRDPQGLPTRWVTCSREQFEEAQASPEWWQTREGGDGSLGNEFAARPIPPAAPGPLTQIRAFVRRWL